MLGLLRWFWPLERPAAWVPLLLGATSIASLLAYFFGLASLGMATRWILLPAVAFFVGWLVWNLRRGNDELTDRVLAGLWAGALATLAYDVVRVPISVAGVPVFKAISYFGTLMLGEVRPSLVSEVIGWSYHLSNGVGFGLMFAVAVRVPRLWMAMAWGLFLEIVMLATPYAEVLGYRLSPRFLAITIGAHLVYGAALWAAVAAWQRGRDRAARWFRLGGLALAVAGVGAVGGDSFRRHAPSIPPSPPPYIGEHLYTTWSVPEPDRVAVLWLVERFVDPKAQFHYIEPFSAVRFGTPIDIPEANVRRSGARSATERLVEELGLVEDPAMRALGEMTHLFEIARWRLPAHPDAHRFGLELIEAVGACEEEPALCMRRGMSFLDEWYEASSTSGDRSSLGPETQLPLQMTSRV